uniref:Uncharacterized protein n=1 Tax=Tetranychus urticae TaxID=32264 RepID=T1KTQ1_TETUR
MGDSLLNSSEAKKYSGQNTNQCEAITASRKNTFKCSHSFASLDEKMLPKHKVLSQQSSIPKKPDFADLLDPQLDESDIEDDILTTGGLETNPIIFDRNRMYEKKEIGEHFPDDSPPQLIGKILGEDVWEKRLFKGTHFLISTFTAHWNSDVYADPDKFDPKK